MKIAILYDVSGAKKAKGIVVVVDILRAASLTAQFLHKNAKYIIPVSTKEEAFEYKKNNPTYRLAGEENGIPIQGFDHSNSPSEVDHLDFTDTVIIHRSTQGTQGLVHAKQADELIFGSFSVVSAIVKYIQKKKPNTVSIVAMDGKGSEDDIFAHFLKDKLKGKKADEQETITKITKLEIYKQFTDPSYSQFPEEDLQLCLTVDLFDFVPLVQRYNDVLKIKAVKNL